MKGQSRVPLNQTQNAQKKHTNQALVGEKVLGEPDHTSIIYRANHPNAPLQLSPTAILHLQRTIGNAAVQRMLTAPQHGATTSRVISQDAESGLRRKIGFEIETGIPVTNRVDDEKTGEGHYTKVKHDTLNAPTGDGSKLDIDKHFGYSILEFISVAVDDTLPAENFEQTAESWLDTLNNLREEAESTPPPKQLRQQIGGARSDAYYGFPPGDTTDKHMLDRVSIQMTHGVKLFKVAKLLSNLDLSAMGGSGLKTAKTNVAHEAVTTADRIMATITAAHDPSKRETDKSKRKRRVEEFRGFVSLVCNYLLIGRHPLLQSGFLKGRTPLFYKSKLSDVVIKLQTRSPFAAKVLGSKYLPTFKTALLTETQRNGNETLFLITRKEEPSPTVDKWLDDVLSGVGDPAFEAMKNSYSDDIAPGRVQGRRAVVMEHRNIMDEMKLENPVLSDQRGVVDYLVALYEANQQMQKIKPRKPAKT